MNMLVGSMTDVTCDSFRPRLSRFGNGFIETETLQEIRLQVSCDVNLFPADYHEPAWMFHGMRREVETPGNRTA
jgi:hypothetical protein